MKRTFWFNALEYGSWLVEDFIWKLSWYYFGSSDDQLTTNFCDHSISPECIYIAQTSMDILMLPNVHFSIRLPVLLPSMWDIFVCVERYLQYQWCACFLSTVLCNSAIITHWATFACNKIVERVCVMKIIWNA